MVDEQATQFLDLFDKLKKVWVWLPGLLLGKAVVLLWLANNPEFPNAVEFQNVKDSLGSYFPTLQQLLVPALTAIFWVFVLFTVALCFRRRVEWIAERLGRPTTRLAEWLMCLGVSYLAALIVAAPSVAALGILFDSYSFVVKFVVITSTSFYGITCIVVAFLWLFYPEKLKLS